MTDIERLLVMLFGEPKDVRPGILGDVRYNYETVRIYSGDALLRAYYDANPRQNPKYFKSPAELYRLIIKEDLLKLREELCMI